MDEVTTNFFLELVITAGAGADVDVGNSKRIAVLDGSGSGGSGGSGGER